MYYYFKQDDGDFTHFYRIETSQWYGGEKHQSLHINVTSACINHSTLEITHRLEISNENEFNEALRSTIDSLQLTIPVKKFTFT